MESIGQNERPSTTLKDLLASLKPHDHLCLIYESENEWSEAIVPFIQTGLDQGQKCIYVVDTNTAKYIREVFKGADADLAGFEESGQFSILHERDTYTQEGFFDPDLLISETKKALEEGYTALRVTGEMTWALRKYTGSERLLEYEAKLNRDFFPDYPCIAICQYNRWKFDPEIIKGVVLTHPQLIRGNRIYRNFYYIEPEEYFNHKKSEREVQHWLNNLERERRFHESLKESEDRYRSVVSSLSEGIILQKRTGEILTLNESAERILDVRAEEMVGKLSTDHNWNMIREDGSDFPAELHPSMITLRTGKPCENVVMGHKDSEGKITWVNVNTKPIFKENGMLPDAVVVSFSDITRRREAEQATKEAHERLLAVMDGIDSLIYVADMKSYEVLFVNKHARELWGDVVGEKCWKVLQQGQEGPCDFCTNDKLMDENGRPTGVYQWEFRKTRDGRWYELHDSALRWIDGRMVRMEVATDITDRKELEQELRENNIRLQLAYEGANLGIWDHDFVTNQIVRTGMWAEMLGYSPEEVESSFEAWSERIHPDDCERVMRATDEYLRGETDEFKFAHRLKCKNGDYKWVLNWGKVTSRDEGGKAKRAIGVHVDISELREAQEALEASEARWKFALEGAGDGVWDLNPTTGEIYYSPRWKEMLGYDEADIENTHDAWEALLHPDDKRRVLEEVEKCFSGKTASYQNEHRLRCKDGTYKWILARGKVIDWAEEGKPLRIVGTHTDITERRRAEDALRESEERFRTLVYSVPGAIFRCAFDEHWTMEYLSEQIEAITGHPADEFLGNRSRSYNSIIHPDDRKKVQHAVSGRVAAGEFYSIDYRVLHADGSIRWVSENGQAVHVEGREVQHLAGVIVDVTESKLANEKLRETEERFRLLFENSAASIIIFDKDTGDVIDANPAAIESHGLKDLEELRKNDLWLDSPYSVKEAHEWMQKAAKEGPQQFEWLSPKASGGLFWKDVRLSKIELGKSERILSIAVDITERKKAEEALQESMKQLTHITESAIVALAAAVDLRDPYTAGHQRRVAQLSVAIAERIKLDSERVVSLRLAAMVHDAGKIQVPSEILNRPGQLGNLEMLLIREHPKAGWELFRKVEFAWPLAEVIYQHHERLDGSGYPRGLVEGEILPEAKILAVADVVEAMSSHRPYRQTLGIEAALKEIKQNAGILYDKDVVDICVELFEEKGFEFEE